MTASDRFQRAIAAMPLIAILRGITPAESTAIGQVLVDAGIQVIEVPMNSPQALDSIGRLAKTFGDRAVIGAGTVMAAGQAHDIRSAGAELLVMPHSDPAVIAAGKALRLAVVPGVMTPTEAFAALARGADALKLFPAEAIAPAAVRAVRAVLPPATRLIPVGGIVPGNIGDYRKAGADAFGIGSALYRPGRTARDVADLAWAFVAAVPRA